MVAATVRVRHRWDLTTIVNYREWSDVIVAEIAGSVPSPIEFVHAAAIDAADAALPLRARNAEIQL